ncbi:MAG: hypothetical protein FWC41_05420 [Firmicutes bacterium]|nr:hypothetical protein [Bacillota bacterium]
MTLIVGILTNEKNFLICDKIHSLDGTKEEPVKVIYENIKITSPSVRINTGTKVYKLNDNILIGGAGDYDKIRKYIETIKDENFETIIGTTHAYYSKNKQESPDQMLIMVKDKIVTIDAFYQYTNAELYSYLDCQHQINDINIGVVPIGSGAQLFLTMYNHIKEKCINEYKEAIKTTDYTKWEVKFLEKIKQMYTDISKYDDAVGSDVEIYEL